MITSALYEIFGTARVLTDTDSLQNWGQDWTKGYIPAPRAIVFPVHVAEIQKLVQLAIVEKLGLVPSGGRTGLSGGAVACQGEVVVSFDRMNQILGFNANDRIVTCQAGVTTRQLQEFAKEQHLFYPVDLASAGSSQIGGNIATNAGGLKVVRYGLTRSQVAGLTVVTGQGELMELNHGLMKNATGYDLLQLFIGSEGTLGFITHAMMRLTRLPKRLQILLAATPNFSSLLHIFQTLRAQSDLTAFECFCDKALEYVIRHTGLSRPFPEQAPFYALAEFETDCDHDLEAMMQAWEECVNNGWIVHGVLSQNSAQFERLWRLRENITESLAPYQPYKNDIAALPSQLPRLVAELELALHSHFPEVEIVWFGHLGDGNLHLNILDPARDQRRLDVASLHHLVLGIVAKYHGSISAEHGVGLLKKPYLAYSRTPTEIACMKAIKAIFDPNHILNPGKIV